jgi:hypothetical protein
LVIERSLAALRNPRLAPVMAVGCLVVLTLGVFARHLFGHWTFQWDFLGSFSTAPAFVGATIGSGHPLSWSPFVASGFPVEVDPQAGIYFPVWWVLGALAVPLNLTAVTAVQVAHVFFGAAGVLALARARRIAWPWATAAAAAYLFFGGFYGESEHADIFRGFAYLPWLLWSLTPPGDDRKWLRLVAVPPVAWLIASGAYPGQLVAFSLVGTVYVVVALLESPGDVWRRYWIALALAAIASAAVAAAVLLPYLVADHRHELIRVYEPTAAIRAAESYAPLDLLGLELNAFALHPDGSVVSWALALPVLIGLACSTRATIRRHLPMVACGTVALALATTPRIGFVGRAMVALGPLFPSRLPASDYKAAIAVAIVILSAEAWGHIASDENVRTWPAIVVACALAAAALLAHSTYAPTTRTLWLLLLVIAATAGLIIRRPRLELLVVALIALIAVDGIRDARDVRLKGTISAWQVPPSQAVMYRANERYVDNLGAVLRRAPTTRPARVPPWAPVSGSPRGNPPDAAGWVADGYHFIDYTGPLSLALWQVEQNPTLMRLMLERWHAWVFPCAASCRNAQTLPAPATWHPSNSVRTLSYGAGRIVYAVDLKRPAVMVENELAVPGWHSNTSRAHVINSGIPLRTWRLDAGDYRFIASYQEPDRQLQEAAVIIGLIAWLGSVLLIVRRRRRLPGAGGTTAA